MGKMMDMVKAAILLKLIQVFLGDLEKQCQAKGMGMGAPGEGGQSLNLNDPGVQKQAGQMMDDRPFLKSLATQAMKFDFVKDMAKDFLKNNPDAANFAKGALAASTDETFKKEMGGKLGLDAAPQAGNSQANPQAAIKADNNPVQTPTPTGGEPHNPSPASQNELSAVATQATNRAARNEAQEQAQNQNLNTTRPDGPS